MILGLMSAKEHEIEVAKLKCEIARLRSQIELYKAGQLRQKNQIRALENMVDNARLRERHLEESIDQTMRPLVDQLVHLHIEAREWNKKDEYSCSVSFCAEMVETCFQHGNSETQIDFIAERIAHQLSYRIAQMIKSRNFYREPKPSLNERKQ